MILETKASLIISTGIVLVLCGLFCNQHNGIVVCFGEKQYKKIDIVFNSIILMFWLFAICVTESYDLSNYRSAYDQRLSHGKEPIFDLIRFFFHDRNWSFDTFKLLWITVILFLVFLVIQRLSSYPSKVVALGIITPLTGFITQMRSAMVGAIALYSFLFLLSGRKRDRIIYALIMIFASQLHIVGYCFLIFLFINPQKSHTFKPIYYGIIAVVTLFALVLSSRYSEIINQIIRNIPVLGSGLDRVVSYFQGEESHFRHMFFLICKHLFLFYLTDKACARNEVKAANGIVKNKATIQRCRMIREANTLILVFLPVTIISASFERLFNCFSIVQYSMVFNSGMQRMVLPGKIKLPIKTETVLIIGVILFFAAETYFSPNDIIMILNSVKWPF